MSIAPLREFQAGLERVSRPVRYTYAGIAAVLAAYLVSLILRHGSSGAFDNWFATAVELSAAGLCFLRAFSGDHGRTLPVLIGAALLTWAAGDLVVAIESALGPVSSPSFADLFYLLFYPTAYAVLLVLIRRDAGRLLPGSWLDGAVAGLGAAALCATFLFASVQHLLGGSPASVATNLAYPIGDLVLLGLAAGGSAALSGSSTSMWRVVALACAVNVAGDTCNLLDTAQATAATQIVDGIAWPLSLVLLSLASWLPLPVRGGGEVRRAPGFLLTGVGAAAGIAVLLAGTAQHANTIGIAVGTAALLVAGLRLGLSVRGLSRMTEERQRLALTDELTSVGNRRMLGEILDAFFAELANPEAPVRRLCFLFLDLDHFKEVNDSFGHAAGDALLRQLGPRLQSALRSGDTLVRLGGDELGVVLMDTTVTDAVAVAERMVKLLGKPFEVQGVRVNVSASIGIATAPGDACDPHTLLRRADVAMYRAKLSRAGVAVYDAEFDDESKRLHLADELRLAVEERSFQLHFQPQVDLRTGEMAAVEALLRWRHPRLGNVPPLHFLPLAEELGLMRPLTSMVLDLALEQCARWHRSGSPLSMSINVSASNLMDDGFSAMVQAALERHRVLPSSCILEITETTVIADFQLCKSVIEELRSLGVAVSIDDFGAGFTSLAYLGSLAVTEVKLDRSFVTGLTRPERERDRELVRATINLGHALGLRVVAEGIEDPNSLQVLTAMGCDVAQGWYLGRPVPAEQLSERVGGTALAS